MRKRVLFYCPSQRKLAEELTSIGSRIEKGEVNWGKFDDGFPDLNVLNSESLPDTDVIFLADFYNGEEIFRQLAVIYALPSYGINSLRVMVPFFSTGTMDRVAETGQVVTAKTLARMLSVIPPAACPAQIIIFDIHALQEQFYFSDKVRVRCLTGIDLFMDHLQQEGKTKENTAIAFPDEGAYKRFARYFKGYDFIVCEKRHLPGGVREVKIKEGSAKGKAVVMVDDLILSGNTLLECAKVLFNDGALSVGAYATHGVFPKKNWQEFFKAGIKLYLTNSFPETLCLIDDDKPSEANLSVISLARVILGEIIGYN